MDPTYFTCTLGQAKLLGQRSPFHTVNELIDIKAKDEGDTPAVGFYEPGPESTDQWKSHILTFRDVQRGCEAAAVALAPKLRSAAEGTVALLSPSSAEFLFTWLALIRLGYPVLLIAPQCSPSAISHLCQACGVRDLIYDDQYEELARSASPERTDESTAINIFLHPFTGQEVFEVMGKYSASGVSSSITANETDIAYLHHTSGTSSGVPKPIAQSHHAAVGALPVLNGRHAATFTTTPLYHGGIADLFRAWTSNALIWLFPGKSLPITANNVCKCLEVATQHAEKSLCAPIKYFSSVPYILQMMASSEQGLKRLQGMDIVGVGGAALPPDVGNMLVEKGVNLISRFGSAECGFLMSSHREYSNDKAWDYLRSSTGGKFLRFEKRDENLLELVIQQGWPHIAKRNREDGSFATADLFMRHPSIPEAWRYHSRSDSQLTLITGKKFDPASLEDAIKVSSTLIEDVLIFGNGKPYAGMLLFRSRQASSMSDDEFVDQISPGIEKLNKKSQSHAKISRSMCVPMQYQQKPLQKSSKGTTIRTQAENTYSKQIAVAYDGKLTPGDANIPDSEIPHKIREIVLSVVGSGDATHLSHDTDLFSYGADSVACIQIRQALSRLIPGATALPVSVVEDCGTIARLSDFVARLRAGGEPEEEDDQTQLMSDLVDEYRVRGAEPCVRASSPSGTQRQSGLRVLLTGPTGSLGSHLLRQLLGDARVGHIYLLVRGASAEASLGRVTKALTSRGLEIPSNLSSKTTILSCKLSEPDLGLSTADYENLADQVDIIFHLAWSVNFLISLRTIAKTHLSGLRNLLNLALVRPPQSNPKKSPPRFVFCSSVAAVSNLTSLSRNSTSSSTTIPERFIASPDVSGPTGYARSKWVGEAICADAHESTRLKGRISIARVGQLSGATDTGAWSPSEAYPLLLSSAKATGVLPDLQDEVLNWLPVDVAARAFLELAFAGSDSASTASGGAEPDIPVHHVLNPNMAVQWSDLLSWLAPQRGSAFKVVPVAEWLARLAALQDDEQTKQHPALRLLGFWRNAYGAASSDGALDLSAADLERRREGEVPKQPELAYEMQGTFRAMPVLRNAEGSMDEAFVLKLWDWVQKEL